MCSGTTYALSIDVPCRIWMHSCNPSESVGWVGIKRVEHICEPLLLADQVTNRHDGIAHLRTGIQEEWGLYAVEPNV